MVNKKECIRYGILKTSWNYEEIRTFVFKNFKGYKVSLEKISLISRKYSNCIAMIQQVPKTGITNKLLNLLKKEEYFESFRSELFLKL